MSATPLRATAQSAPQSYPAGTVLATNCAAVGVLIEAGQRRLIATQPIAAGTEIFTLVGRESRHPTRYTIQVGPEFHLECDDLADDAGRVYERYWMYLNHSCTPSAWVRGLSVMALHDIAAGEGVTFDYNTTEASMAEAFDCHCGTAACVGMVKGYRHLNAAQQARLQSYLAEHLR
jgi:hypothetical protein